MQTREISSFKPDLRAYISLTKPGIIGGNAMTAVAGLALASQGSINFWLLASMLTGLSLIIASACVFNNCIDRFADGKMARTQHRPLPTGVITVRDATIFGIALALCGIFVLAYYTHLLTLFVALTGLVVYITLYSVLKYRTSYATEIGAIAGAVPPVVGYTAVTHELDMGAWLLFAIVFLWQMPHFYAIAIYRMEEYAAAKIPVLPIKKGIPATKRQMMLYLVAFLVASLLLGYVYLIAAALWLGLGIRGFKAADDKVWARKMFIASLIVITALCVTIVIS